MPPVEGGSLTIGGPGRVGERFGGEILPGGAYLGGRFDGVGNE
jgi:hypothetical protein